MIRATTRPRRSAGARSAANGNHHLSGHRGGTHGNRRQPEDPDVGGQGTCHQGDRSQKEDARDQHPPLGSRSPSGTTSRSPAA